MTPTITFLSHCGLSDELIGVVHGVLATGRPDARSAAERLGAGFGDGVLITPG